MKLMSVNLCSRNLISSTVTTRGIHKSAFLSSSIMTPSTFISKNSITTASRSFNSCRILPNVSGTEIQASFGNMEFEGKNVANAMEALAKADAVCFDVDSTVIQEEGIDVLAASLGKGEEVSAWTKKAMDGNTKFEDALAARLDIIQPSRASIEQCLKDHPLELSPGVDDLIEALQDRGIDVYLISGGFRIMIEPLAKTLCVGKSNIIANTIFFDDDTPTGEYAGFCREEPTSADMGKPKAVQQIKDEHGYKTIIMVGDGATDAQAKPPADAFIGFGGVAVREAVREKACWFIRDFDTMTKVIQNFSQEK